MFLIRALAKCNLLRVQHQLFFSDMSEKRRESERAHSGTKERREFEISCHFILYGKQYFIKL